MILARNLASLILICLWILTVNATCLSLNMLPIDCAHRCTVIANFVSVIFSTCVKPAVLRALVYDLLISAVCACMCLGEGFICGVRAVVGSLPGSPFFP